jgi:hypothetical protein
MQHVVVYHIWRFTMRPLAMPFDALLEHSRLAQKERVVRRRFVELFR